MAIQSSEGLLSPFLCHKRLAAAKPYLKGRGLDFGCGSGRLAEFVPPELYLGVDISPESLVQAHDSYPNYQFVQELPDGSEKFDTIVALAVIEHVPAPLGLLRTFTSYLSDRPYACIVLTTPHPSMDWVHATGAALGLFSRHANEEHEELLGLGDLKHLGEELGLDIRVYRRFLLGANQLVVYSNK